VHSVEPWRLDDVLGKLADSGFFIAKLIGRSPSTLLSSCNICLAGPLKSPSVGFASICSVLLFRAAIKIGALLNSERLMVNIANDMRLRLENHVAALDGPLNFTVNNHALSNDTSDDLGLRRDNE
jgi:hypothetical protein